MSGLEYSRQRISESWASTFSISLKDCSSCTLQRGEGGRHCQTTGGKTHPLFSAISFPQGLFLKSNFYLFLNFEA